MPIAAYIPAKETWSKIASTTIVGTGAIVSSAGALSGNDALKNIGAVSSLIGSLVDDVPESWLRARADRTYTQMLKLVQPNVRYIARNAPMAFAEFNTDDSNDTEPVTKCARHIQFFTNHVFHYEIARVENFPESIKTVLGGVAFGLSALDWGVGTFGVIGIAVGSLSGLFLCLGTHPRAADQRRAPAPFQAPEQDQLADYPYHNLENNPLKPNYAASGDYKARIAVVKLCAAVATGAFCCIGLAITSTRSISSRDNYIKNDFVAALTNGVTLGAAVGGW